MNSEEQAMQPLIDAVAGRRVVVVGNARSLFGQGLGERIDGFDLVVRMNLGRIEAPEHQGRRTDILFSSTEKLGVAEIEDWFAPRWVVWATPRREKMPELSALGERLLVHPLAWWEPLYQRTAPARPSTGLIALNFFHRHCRCAELAFAGFDFFASGTFYARRFLGLLPAARKSSKAHEGEGERVLAEEMMRAGGLYNLAEGKPA